MRLLALFFTLILLTAPALAGTGTITISGNSTANATATVTGTNNVVTISAWNTGNGIKTFRVNVTNASDTLTFNLNNFTVGRVNEFKLNSTPQNGYQADSTGLITYTFTQITGNATYNLQPAVTQGGFNYTWGWFNNPLPNVSIPTSAMNYSVMRYNMTEFTKNMSDSSATQSITNIGFKPVFVSCQALVGATTYTSMGYSDGIANYSSFRYTDGNWYQNNDYFIEIEQSASDRYSGALQSFDTDGFTISWTRFSTPTNTLNIQCEARR